MLEGLCCVLERHEPLLDWFTIETQAARCIKSLKQH